MRALDDAVRAGKVLHVGISDTPAWVVATGQHPRRWRGRSPVRRPAGPLQPAQPRRRARADARGRSARDERCRLVPAGWRACYRASSPGPAAPTSATRLPPTRSATTTTPSPGRYNGRRRRARRHPLPGGAGVDDGPLRSRPPDPRRAPARSAPRQPRRRSTSRCPPSVAQPRRAPPRSTPASRTTSSATCSRSSSARPATWSRCAAANCRRHAWGVTPRSGGSRSGRRGRRSGRAVRPLAAR